MITMFRPSLLTIVVLLAACKADISVQEEPVDPVVQEIALAFVERPLLINDEESFSSNLQDPTAFNPGARLLVKQNAFAQSAETDITAAIFAEAELYDVKDLVASPDGMTLVFALRAPELENVPDELQPKWDLWRYDVASKSVSPLIADPQQAQRGHDISPAFLPDGRIVFSSTRQSTSRQILLDEFKPQYTALDENLNSPTFNLHVMNADGSQIEQISFNLSHDLYPVVLDDGRILYSRWDNHGNRSMFNWYRMRPDGSDNELVYGWHSHNTGAAQSRVEFGKAIVLEDGSVTVALASADAPYYNAWPQRVALQLASDNEQPLEGEVLNLPAQTPLFPWAFDNTSRAERSGAVNSYTVVKDNSGRFLVSWSPCRVIENDMILSCAQRSEQDELTLAAPLYGLWLFDTVKQTQIPVRPGNEGLLVAEPVVLQPYPDAAFLPLNPDLDSELAAENAAVLDIRSVYDFAGQASVDLSVLSDPMRSSAVNRPARYLRLVRGVPLPPEEVLEFDDSAFGVSRLQLMRDILGVTPIQPDGSVRVKVPANVPFTLSVLNAQGQAISPLHQQWITARPGETLNCNGCHTAQSTAPHGRRSQEAASANTGLTVAGRFSNTAPALTGEAGDTMAQLLARLNGDAVLDEALRYLDIWTDPALRQPDPAEEISFSSLETAQPDGVGCYQQWLANCRLQLHYPQHIQPLWAKDRRRFAADGELLADHSCLSCHSRTDADGNSRVPLAQLELDDAASDLEAQHLRSYRELLSNDNELELVGGVLVDRLVQATDENGNLLFVTDENGDLVLDDDGNPIPVMEPVTVTPAMRANSAIASNRFFNLFAQGGSHQGYLSQAELMMLASWLDIGAQYYNSPFAVPEQ